MISVKGVVNFSNWICGEGNRNGCEGGACGPASRGRREPGAPGSRRPSANAVHRGQRGRWPLVRSLSWGWGGPRARDWDPGPHGSRQGLEEPSPWGGWVCDDRARPRSTKYRFPPLSDSSLYATSLLQKAYVSTCFHGPKEIRGGFLLLKVQVAFSICRAASRVAPPRCGPGATLSASAWAAAAGSGCAPRGLFCRLFCGPEDAQKFFPYKLVIIGASLYAVSA